MTDVVTPSLGGDSLPYQVAQVIKNAGANDPGWVVPSGDIVLGDRDPNLAGAPFNGFTESHSATSFDVTIDTGEAFCEGAWVARDVTTTVTLASGTTGQTVYLGWDVNATDTVIIGLSSAFAADDPKYPIHEFDTDTGGVTASRDQRTVGFGIRAVIEGADNSTMGLLGLLGAASSYAGTLGGSQNEVFRAPGSTSDMLLSVNDGSGQTNLAYNCYYDGSWRFIVGNEPAFRVAFDGGVSLYASSATGTAGSVIGFHSMSLDAGTGDLLADATKFYDHGTHTVPQGSLGGPASSLTSYPLPAGDISDGSGSGLDADTVDGYDSSQLLGGDGEWSLVDSVTDTNTGTILDLDTGALTTTYDVYRVVWHWHNHHDGSTYTHNEGRVRVNGIGTSDYNITNVSGGTGVETQSNKNSWENLGKVECNTDAEGYAEVIIRGAAAAGAKTSERHPTIAADSNAGTYDTWQLEHGTLRRDIPQIDRVRAYSLAEGTGDVKIQGKNL